MLPELIISPVISLITQIIGRVWPDKTEQQKAELAVALQEDHDFNQLMQGQLQVNQAEAASGNVFIAGWRPMVGWVCATAFAWQFVLMPVLIFLSNWVGHPVPVPTFDVSTMLTVLMGMLGMGGLRTYEKINGVTK